LKTAVRRIARVVGAGIAIVTVGRTGPDTGPIDTTVLGGARVTVIAGPARIGRQQTARPGLTITCRGEARCIEPLGRRTTDHARRINPADIGNRSRVAIKRAIAEVTIFQCPTITVVLAVTGDRFALADAVRAMVPKGTRVFIVAIPTHGREIAATIDGADIVSTRVLVIADHRFPDALSGLTVIGHGTGIGVAAIALFQHFVDAAFGTGTDILGALIPVIAEVDEIALHQVRFIHIAVTIIVESVARFGHGHGGIARTQAALGTNALPLAFAPFIADLAGRRQPESDGLFCARALPGIDNTLEQRHAIDGLGLCTRKSPGTIAVQRAGTAAETPAGPVVDTGVF
jgi:hypothetical protein